MQLFIFIAVLLIGALAQQKCKTASQGQNPGSTTAANRHIISITTAGGSGTRTYQLYVPANVTYPAALVFAWHGITSCAQTLEGKVKLQAEADRYKFLAVYPVAQQTSLCGQTSAAFNGAGCCSNTATANDVELFDAIVANLTSPIVGCVNPARVFALGFSNGGFMTHRLGCERGSRLAAISQHSGNYGDYNGKSTNTLSGTQWNLAKCQAYPLGSKKLPNILIHGTSDATVPYNGGKNPSLLGTSYWDSFVNTAYLWKNLSRCTTTVQNTSSWANGATTTSVTSLYFSGGSNCSGVEAHSLTSYGHDWHPTATSKIVAFFRRFGL